LSVVVASRNDDHGGDPLKRLQALVNTFAVQCRRTHLDAELIVVEWNPPLDRLRVRELLRVPADTPFLVRFIEVAPELHATLRHSEVLPLFQMIAKNVGIRRAHGEFVLATNIDIIFSTELVEALAAQRLEPGRMYRVERHDIEPNYPIDASLERQMEYCRTRQLRIHAQPGTYPVDSTGHLQRLASDITGSPQIALEHGWHILEGDNDFGFYRWAMEEATFSIAPEAFEGIRSPVALDIEFEPNIYQSDVWVDVEVSVDGTLLGRRRIDKRVTLRFALNPETKPRAFTLRMMASSGGRDMLPFFDVRPRLCYRVRRIAIVAIPPHVYELALWHRVTDSAALTIVRTDRGVAIASDPGRFEYCARYAPFQAPTDGVYDFALEHETAEGRFQFAAMDIVHRCWLPARAFETEADGRSMVTLSVSLQAGTRFALYVANNRPEGGVSRFTLRRLTASVPFADLYVPTFAMSGLGRAANRAIHVLRTPLRLARAAISRIERRRAQRFEDLITEDSARLRECKSRIDELLPLTELAPVVKIIRAHRPSNMFQNASGDFQLMAREHWLALRGYPELEMFSMSIDGLMEAIAVAAGIVEEPFSMPRCIYHLEHERGSGWTPEGEALLRRRIDESGVTWLDTQTVNLWASYMRWLGRPMIFNGDAWGFGDQKLPEHHLSATLSGR
jgi:hypothetical protein